jgi:hypothetical protein
MKEKVFKMVLTDAQKLKYYSTGCRQHYYNCRDADKKCIHLPTAQLCIKSLYFSKKQTKPDLVKTLTCFTPQL